MRNINSNSVQGHLSENYLTQNFITRKFSSTFCSKFPLFVPVLRQVESVEILYLSLCLTKNWNKLELCRAHTLYMCVPRTLCSHCSIVLQQSCSYDLMTLSYTELKYAQSYQYLPVEWMWWTSHRHAE